LGVNLVWRTIVYTKPSLILVILILQEWNMMCSGVYMVKKNSHVEILISHFKNVVWPSFKNIRVLSYILVSVAFVGGAGIWMPWVKAASVNSWLPGATVFTYCFALLGSIICNRLYFYTKSLSEIRTLYKNNSEEEKIQSHFQNLEEGSILSAWGMIFGSFIIILITIAYSKFYANDSIYGWVGLILSMLLYFVASAEDLDRKSSVIPKAKDRQDAIPLVPQSIGESDVELNSDFFSDGEQRK
jgi:hypothetical protein